MECVDRQRCDRAIYSVRATLAVAIVFSRTGVHILQSHVTAALGRFAAETRADRIPAAAIVSAKLKFLDTLAVAVAGSRHRSSIISLEVAKQLGGNPHCAIIGRNERASVELAGYVNAVSAHALEYDDYTKSVTHASVCLVPGALALAEWLGAGGKAMLDAFAFGFEI